MEQPFTRFDASDFQDDLRKQRRKAKRPALKKARLARKKAARIAARGGGIEADGMDTGSLDDTHGIGQAGEGHTGQGHVEPEGGKQGGVQLGEGEDGFPNTKGADVGVAEEMSTRKADGDASSRNDAESGKGKGSQKAVG